MTENTWPNPARPGVPLNPEKDGWHWVSLLGGGHPQIMEWFSDAMVWADGWTVEACAKHLRYLGPVLTPDEAAALQKRCEESERERDALRRDASQQVATDELVRRLQHLGDWQAADRIEAQGAEIARLRAELATARREGMVDAAKWHEVRSMELSGKAGLARNFRQLLRQSDFHMESAAAIRAAAKEGKP